MPGLSCFQRLPVGVRMVGEAGARGLVSCRAPAHHGGRRLSVAGLDDVMRLVGDEDCGVGVDCRVCDRGGAPIAYYAGIDDRAYEGTDVEVVHTITALIEAGQHHAASHAE